VVNASNKQNKIVANKIGHPHHPWKINKDLQFILQIQQFGKQEFQNKFQTLKFGLTNKFSSQLKIFGLPSSDFRLILKIMKTIITILLVAIASVAFSSKYEETMKTNIDKLYSINSPIELQALANQFERIANAEQDKWLPNYYAAYCYVSSTFFDNIEVDDKHKQLDKAQSLIDEIQKKNSEESEVYALQAFVYQLRITDMSKGAKYSMKALSAIAEAEKLNPENPRVYYLRGSNTLHTPKFFGGGADKARPDLEKAARMFEKQKQEDALMPSWGNYHNKQLLDQCNKSEE